MKKLLKKLVSTICLSVLVSAITACGGGSGSENNTPGGDDGTLTVANAPLDMEGSFVAQTRGTIASNFTVDILFIGWAEYGLNGHTEGIQLYYDSTTGESNMTVLDSGLSSGEIWSCSDSDGGNSLCSGITVDTIEGTVTFADQVLTTNIGGSTASPITLNGTLYFPPQ